MKLLFMKKDLNGLNKKEKLAQFIVWLIVMFFIFGSLFVILYFAFIGLSYC